MGRCRNGKGWFGGEWQSEQVPLSCLWAFWLVQRLFRLQWRISYHKFRCIGSIFSQSEDEGLVQVSETGLAQVIGETKTVNGKSLTIDELFYDGTRFTFSYSLVSDVPITDNYVIPTGTTIDGQPYFRRGRWR